MNRTAVLIVLVVLLTCGVALAGETITAQEFAAYEDLVKGNSVKMVRQTKEGNIASCDLEYQYTYRDFKAKKGAPVVVQGAFAFVYNKGKNPALIFKLVPTVSDFSAKKLTTVTPEYADVFVGGKSMKQFRYADFACEGGGKCMFYSDKDGAMMKLLFDTTPLDIEIKFSLSKGGIDNSFTLSSLLPKDPSDKYINRALDDMTLDFMNCNVEIGKRVISDIEEMTKKK